MATTKKPKQENQTIDETTQNTNMDEFDEKSTDAEKINNEEDTTKAILEKFKSMIPFIKSDKDKDKKKKSNEKRLKNYKAPLSGYKYTPSFVEIPGTGRYATFLKVNNRYGLNRKKPYAWMTNLIPNIKTPGVRAYFIETDMAMDEQEQRDIINDKVAKARISMGNKENAKDDDAHDATIRQMRINDLDEANKKDGQNEPIIDVRLVLVLVSDDIDAIRHQLNILERDYKDKMNGIQFSSMAGKQRYMLTNLLEMPEDSTYNETWMGSVHAGNDHMIRKGLSDPNGLPIGAIRYNLSSGEALMDLEGSFSIERDGDRRGVALIASSDNSSVSGYTERFGASSLWAQLIANHVMMNGHRVHHIVLNNFRYEGGKNTRSNGMFLVDKNIEQVINRIDLSKGGLNPLEMFGSIDNVVSVYNKSINKIAMIFKLMSGRSLDNTELNALKEALNKFYLSKKLWVKDAGIHPERTRVMNINDHEKFPTAGDLISNLTNMLTSATNSASSTEAERDRFIQLHRNLKNSLDSFSHIFNKATTLPNRPNPKFLQHYYELGGLADNDNIQEAQFLNAFDYITSSIQPHELLVIHGLDRLSIDTVRHVAPTIRMARQRNVRFLYSLDEIGGVTLGADREVRDTDKVDMFNINKILYKNFERSLDYTILGIMNNDEMEAYEKLTGAQRLPDIIRDLLTSGGKEQFQVRRPYDGTSNLVHANFMI